MGGIEKASSDRIIFFDNLRYFFVLCVVLLHSLNAYQPFASWWPVWEKNSSVVIVMLLVFLDVFIMPLLFYIAGYFSLPAIQKHGTSNFIKSKLNRLGIPWIVCILTICPVLPLIYHYTRNNFSLTTSYFDLWITLMKNTISFKTGFITIDNLMVTNGFYQRYMWFISLLLLFFLIFSIFYKAKRSWFDFNKPVTKQNPSAISTIKLLISVGFILFIGSMFFLIVIRLSGPNDPMSSWITIGNIIQVQGIRLPLFIIYFILGIITFRNKWIENGKFPGHFKTWAISLIIISVIFFINFIKMLETDRRSSLSLFFGIIYFLIYGFLSMSILGFSSSLALKYWNQHSKNNGRFASVSYEIYLAHYIFVFLFQLLLLCVPGIPALLKFGIVSVMSIVCAHIVSLYLIKPFPKATIALLFVMLIVMFLVIR